MTDRQGSLASDTNRPGDRKAGALPGFRMALFLGVFWVVLSGHIEPVFVGLGALSVGLVCWLSRRAELSLPVRVTARLALLLPGYSLWLAKEVLVSAFGVARRVWSPRLALVPTVAATLSGGLPEPAQVVYANSITLTPGTLSLEVGEDHIEVHSLDPAGIKSLHAGAMLRRVQRMWAQP